jgi:hypothetical protein
MGLPAVMRQELLPFLIAFAIANSLYKFGSFGLELVAFLATWFALSSGQALLMGLVSGKEQDLDR